MHTALKRSLSRSSFERVLFLDADNLPLRNPDFLFDAPEFEHGAVFWPDAEPMTATRGAAELRRAYQIPANDGPEFETGQILIDKRKCWRELCLTMHLNRYPEFYYPYLFGDKETFRFCFDALAGRYTLVQSPTRRSLYALLQSWVDGSPLFFHRAGGPAKWTKRYPPIPWFPHDVFAGFRRDLAAVRQDHVELRGDTFQGVVF